MVREEVHPTSHVSICSAFLKSTRCLHVIRVAEVPGSNPGAPTRKPRKCGVFYALIAGVIGILQARPALLAESRSRGKVLQSADGIERTWATNHLAPFLLTELLLPLQ